MANGTADLIAFGEAFIASPDLPQRWHINAPLAAADKSTDYRLMPRVTRITRASNSWTKVSPIS
ncbi:hypothetical protein HB779_14175 [Phyllobacterium sp. 628]|uniref:hypothetical protein n=1 Tax=Phyllobacterium sp. 628 TaxID=2718938 RepID=UPI001662445A|nr:hypothetical protein [Phyllobacterium sp. 628]QND52920.1 hypothetical protein HB779_14175 [Phyllobacterium sp. 628]